MNWKNNEKTMPETEDETKSVKNEKMLEQNPTKSKQNDKEMEQKPRKYVCNFNDCNRGEYNV